MEGKALRYFKPHEFACKCRRCGKGFDEMDPTLLAMLDELRHRTHVYQLPQETADISDNVSVEELQEKLRALQNENKQFPPIYICAQMRYNDSKRVCGGTLCGR